MKKNLIVLGLAMSLLSSAFASPTIDLVRARQVALDKIKQELAPQQKIQKEVGFYFVDGAVGTAEEFVSDLGRLYFVVELASESTPMKGILAAYTMGLNGQDSVNFVSLAADNLAVYSTSGNAGLQPNLDQNQERALQSKLQASFPHSQFQILDPSGVLLFSDPANTSAIFRFLKNLPEIQSESVSLNPEAYADPFEFAPPVALQTDARTQDLGDSKLRVVYTSLKDQFKKTGQVFSTLPSLPVTVGGQGPIPNRGIH